MENSRNNEHDACSFFSQTKQAAGCTSSLFFTAAKQTRCLVEKPGWKFHGEGKVTRCFKVHAALTSGLEYSLLLPWNVHACSRGRKSQWQRSRGNIFGRLTETDEQTRCLVLPKYSATSKIRQTFVFANIEKFKILLFSWIFYQK